MFLTAQEESSPMNEMMTANLDYPIAGTQNSTYIYSNVNLPLFKHYDDTSEFCAPIYVRLSVLMYYQYSKKFAFLLQCKNLYIYVALIASLVI